MLIDIDKKTTDNWKESNIQVFWGEIAPCDHVVQIYENDKVFLDTLEGFIGCGLLANDSVIIIATREHLAILEARLKKQGFDIDELTIINQYIPLEANQALSNFMVNDWPDEILFNEFIARIIKRAQTNNRQVRAFGEMVALLWEKGLNGATVQLEHLWNQLHKKDSFSLFCAYPKIGFTQDANSSLETICSSHSKVLDGGAKPSTEIYYKAIA